jgi:hypothetical protein
VAPIQKFQRSVAKQSVGGQHVTRRLCHPLRAARSESFPLSFRGISLPFFTHSPLPIKRINNKQCRSKGTLIREGPTRPSRARLGHLPRSSNLRSRSTSHFRPLCCDISYIPDLSVVSRSLPLMSDTIEHCSMLVSPRSRRARARFTKMKFVS